MYRPDQMRSYPRAKRPIDERAKLITEEHRRVARQFGRDFFDGERLYGYGGYRYDGRWKPVVRDFRDDYKLAEDAAVLDIGCGKGFMMRDFIEMMPKARVEGCDVSQYAYDTADPAAKPFMKVADAKALPYADKSFDLVISINTVHNLPLAECKTSLREIMRVSRAHAFIVVDSWRTEEEHRCMLAWNLTALTYMHANDWEKLFAEVGYTGDWDWFIAASA